jgi:hypothetical protein
MATAVFEGVRNPLTIGVTKPTTSTLTGTGPSLTPVRSSVQVRTVNGMTNVHGTPAVLQWKYPRTRFHINSDLI